MRKVQRTKTARGSRKDKKPRGSRSIPSDNKRDEDRKVHGRLCVSRPRRRPHRNKYCRGSQGDMDNGTSEAEVESVCSLLSADEAVNNAKKRRANDVPRWEHMEEDEEVLIEEEEEVGVGARNLMAAIIWRAYADIFADKDNQQVKLEDRRTARAWLLSKSKEPWSYRWLLENLDIPFPDVVEINNTQFYFR